MKNYTIDTGADCDGFYKASCLKFESQECAERDADKHNEWSDGVTRHAVDEAVARTYWEENMLTPFNPVLIKNKYRCDVAGNGESVWSSNGVQLNTPEECKRWLDELSGRWFGYDLSRIVTASTAKGEPVDLADEFIYQNYRK